MHNRGVISGGSGGSADPPKILEPIGKKLNSKYPDPPGQKLGFPIPLCKIPNVASGF